MELTEAQKANFWSQVNIPVHRNVGRHMPDCWLWKGCITKGGYGTFGRRNGATDHREIKAHRIAYILLRGPIATDLTLDHVCRNRACVNPHHLEPVSLRTNILRGFSPPADNARKTHCTNGHPLSGANLLWADRLKTRRSCRFCTYKRQASWQRVNRDYHNEPSRVRLRRERKRRSLMRG